MDNKQILKNRQAEWNKDQGFRVGDFIFLKGEENPRRIAHVYDDGIQPSTGTGSLYFGNGYMEYSGGLDSFISCENIIKAEETFQGDCWFFDKDIMRAGGRVNFKAVCRVYKEI